MIIMPGENVKIDIDLYDKGDTAKIERRATAEPDVTIKVEWLNEDDSLVTLEGEFAGILNALWDYIQGDDDPIERMTETLQQLERI